MSSKIDCSECMGTGGIERLSNCKHCAGTGKIAAPVVERQPVVQKYDDTLLPFVALMRKELHSNDGKGDRPGWLAMSADTCMLEIIYHFGKLQASVKRGDGDGINEYAADVANMCMMLTDICGSLAYAEITAPPELAELQADIADLQTELAAIKDECIDHVNLYKAWTKERGTLTAEIERLKGGQGEPVAHRIKLNDGQRSGWFDGPPASIYTDDVLDGVIAGVQLAYTSQPAPVSVLGLDVFKALEKVRGAPVLTTNQCYDLARELNACLDKLKELNQPTTIAGFKVVEDPTIPENTIRLCNCNQGRLPCTCKG